MFVCCSYFASDTPWIPQVRCGLSCFTPRRVPHALLLRHVPRRADKSNFFLLTSFNRHLPSRSWCESTSRSRRMLCPTSFGSDLPVPDGGPDYAEGGSSNEQAGSRARFVWCDGVFLRARSRLARGCCWTSSTWSPRLVALPRWCAYN